MTTGPLAGLWSQWACNEPDFGQCFIYYMSLIGTAGYAICRAQHKVKMQGLLEKQEKACY